MGAQKCLFKKDGAGRGDGGVEKYPPAYGDRSQKEMLVIQGVLSAGTTRAGGQEYRCLTGA